MAQDLVAVNARHHGFENDAIQRARLDDIVLLGVPIHDQDASAATILEVDEVLAPHDATPIGTTFGCAAYSPIEIGSRGPALVLRSPPSRDPQSLDADRMSRAAHRPSPTPPAPLPSRRRTGTRRRWRRPTPAHAGPT